MRGKPGDAGADRVHRRIIPAHAGQTLSSSLPPVAHTDHPRACGANKDIGALRIGQLGSSPRMRGKPAAGDAHLLEGRIIPAHAGQTVDTNTVLSMPSDHPRACGGNIAEEAHPLLDSGSSPRMRGKRGCYSATTLHTRIIPAHAGQTIADGLMTTFHSDHPRACGANAPIAGASTPLNGSSPRMRGKHATAGELAHLRRIIPAHAGQTCAGHVA